MTFLNIHWIEGTLTDLILQKLLRVKQIEDNKGKTIVSEGIDANYQDMINYAVFALISGFSVYIYAQFFYFFLERICRCTNCFAFSAHACY